MERLQFDLERAPEIDQTRLFRLIVEREFGTPGGRPYGLLVADYEFSHEPDDLAVLRGVSRVAAAGTCPFIAGVSPRMMNLQDFSQLTQPRDLTKIFDSIEYTDWRAFRESEESRYVALVLPRIMARAPYGPGTSPVEEFDFTESQEAPRSGSDIDLYTWSNAAYVLAERIASSFSQRGWFDAFQGRENGGTVENLPVALMRDPDGEQLLRSPTETPITDRREMELAQLGFVSLCYFKNTDYSVFFSAQTCHRPEKYDDTRASENAAIAARLPCVLAISRFVNYLRAITRDKLGSFMTADDLQRWLNDWIMQYVTEDPSPTEEARSRYPLAQADIHIEPAASPGSFKGIAYLRPWLRLADITGLLRVEFPLPSVLWSSPPPQPVRRIFASYSTQDRSVVQQHRAALASLGIDLIDPSISSVSTNRDFVARIAQEIDAADLLLLFWSAAASRSQGVAEEWRHALRTKGAVGIRIIALGDLQTLPPLPPELAGIQLQTPREVINSLGDSSP